MYQQRTSGLTGCPEEPDEMRSITGRRFHPTGKGLPLVTHGIVNPYGPNPYVVF